MVPPLPGLIISARIAPTTAASKEQSRYQPITFKPMLPKRLMGRLAAPTISEKNISYAYSNYNRNGYSVRTRKAGKNGKHLYVSETKVRRRK